MIKNVKIKKVVNLRRILICCKLKRKYGKIKTKIK